jgi:hypothetical protein
MLSSPFPFLSTVKSLPEEWFQITTTMYPKATSDMELEPIDCHVRHGRKFSEYRDLLARFHISCSFLLLKHLL